MVTIKEYNNFKRSWKSGFYPNTRFGQAFCIYLKRRKIIQAPTDGALYQAISLAKAEELIKERYLYLNN